jgi:hypothetical protein
MFPIKIFDLPSLMAGKLHAIFFRGYDKGRDRYDLAWYLSKSIEPNQLLLKNAILQTQKDATLAQTQWKILLKDKVQHADFGKIRQDVKQFLMHPEEIVLLSQEHFMQLIG